MHEASRAASPFLPSDRAATPKPYLAAAILHPPLLSAASNHRRPSRRSRNCTTDVACLLLVRCYRRSRTTQIPAILLSGSQSSSTAATSILLVSDDLETGPAPYRREIVAVGEEQPSPPLWLVAATFLPVSLRLCVQELRRNLGLDSPQALGEFPWLLWCSIVGFYLKRILACIPVAMAAAAADRHHRPATNHHLWPFYSMLTYDNLVCLNVWLLHVITHRKS